MGNSSSIVVGKECYLSAALGTEFNKDADISAIVVQIH